MDILDTPLPGLRFVRLESHRDARGAFSRIADRETLHKLGAGHIGQVNLSTTGSVGTLRGLHMQRPPSSGWKMVVCLTGRIWDLALDLRHDSPTLRRWHGAELGPMEALSLPPGCAHGFQVLEGPAELLYLMSEPYIPEAEFRVHPMDPSLDVLWPIPVSLLSDADARAPFLPSDFDGVSP